MRLALDTNCLTALFAGDRALHKLAENAEEVFIPFIVEAEMKAGFLGGKRKLHNDALLAEFFRKPNVSPLFATAETVRIWAELFIQLRRAGKPIPDNDLWIAALSLQHDLALATRDSHFQSIGQLHLV